MITWLLILVPAAIIGSLCRCFIKNRIGIILSGLLPFTSLLFFLRYYNFFLFSQKTDGLIWQLFGSTIAAIVGIGFYLMNFRLLFSKKIAN